MKKAALLILSLFIMQQSIFADTSVYSENNRFGLKDNYGNVITKAKYKKLVRLGSSSWIVQDRTKFGIISDSGEIIVKPIYNQAERVLGKYVKFRKGDKYGIFDEYGNEIIEIKYSLIDLLYGGMYVTCLNHKYGIYTIDGYLITDNIFDDIYMPDHNTLIMVYGEELYEFKRTETDKGIPFEILFPDNLSGNDVKVSDMANNPVASTGYYGITITDYILKLISSISPAYEQTIDELMYSQGADTVNVIMKCAWIPQFPFVYAKKYYQNVSNPYNGPLGKAKKTLRNKIRD